MGDSQGSMTDLYGIQNQFYLGNYQQVVTDASAFNARGDATAKLECDVILNRAHVAMGNHSWYSKKSPATRTSASRP